MKKNNKKTKTTVNLYYAFSKIGRLTFPPKKRNVICFWIITAKCDFFIIFHDTQEGTAITYNELNDLENEVWLPLLSTHGRSLSPLSKLTPILNLIGIFYLLPCMQVLWLLFASRLSNKNTKAYGPHVIVMSLMQIEYPGCSLPWGGGREERVGCGGCKTDVVNSRGNNLRGRNVQFFNLSSISAFPGS